MNTRFKHSNNSVHNIGYHLIWCTKYRRKLLTPDVEQRLKTLLEEKSQQLEVLIKTMEVMPDHVRVFIECSPKHTPHLAVKGLKGYTSRMLRREFATLRSRVPTLWTNSYYMESIGNISEDTATRYIQEQKNQ